MTIDIHWFDACSVTHAFSAKQKAAGWPEQMHTGQLAGLQRPWDASDEAQNRAHATLQAALDAACKAGELACNETREQGQPPPRRRVLSHGIGDVASAFTGSPRPAPPPPVPMLRYYVTAPAFAVWLHAQGEEPSQHMAAWFAVRGVAWPPVITTEPTTFAELGTAVRGRKPGTRWGHAEKVLLFQEFELRGGWIKKGNTWVKGIRVKKRLASELGLTPNALDRHLDAIRRETDTAPVARVHRIQR